MGVALTLLLCGLAVSASAAVNRMSIPGGELRIGQRGAATVVAVTRGGRTMRTVLPVEEGVFAGSLDSTRLVGALPGRVLILSSDYASRPGGPMHMCGAGTETVLRVIALQPAPHQTFHQRIASCWRTIEPGDIAWDRGARMLSVERTTVDGPQARDLETLYRITTAGAVTPTGVERRP